MYRLHILNGLKTLNGDSYIQCLTDKVYIYKPLIYSGSVEYQLNMEQVQQLFNIHLLYLYKHY